MRNVHQNGFTLLELMTTLLVVALLLGIGVPGFQNFIDTNRMAAVVNEMIGTLHTARAEAVKQRANVTVCASANWDSAAPDCTAGALLRDGWIMFVDGIPPVAANGTVDGADVVLRTHGPMPDTLNSVSVDPGVTLRYFSFAPNGFSQQIGGLVRITNIQLCDRRGDKDTGGGIAAGRWVAIAPTGRPQVFNMQIDVQGGPLGGC